eukprot:c15698_g1_i1 orf=96-704(+)
MGQHMRPLFELIIEESRRKASWDDESCKRSSHHEEEAHAAAGPNFNHNIVAKRLPSKKAKVRWLPRRGKKAAVVQDMRSDDDTSCGGVSRSPTKCSSEYESAADSFSWSGYGTLMSMSIEELQGDVGLPCLQDDGERYLEVAMAMDMMELCIAQVRAKRNAALAQVVELRFALDSMRNRLHQVEQYCLQLNYQLFMKHTGRP